MNELPALEIGDAVRASMSGVILELYPDLDKILVVDTVGEKLFISYDDVQVVWRDGGIIFERQQ